MCEFISSLGLACVKTYTFPNEDEDAVVCLVHFVFYTCPHAAVCLIIMEFGNWWSSYLGC
jgi:hypothetical protein